MPFTLEHSLRCRGDFPALARTPLGLNLAYLDGPAGSQVPQAVIDAFGNFYATCNVNTRGNFWPSQEVDRRLATAREVLAAFLGAVTTFKPFILFENFYRHSYRSLWFCL